MTLALVNSHGQSMRLFEKNIDALLFVIAYAYTMVVDTPLS